MSFEAQPPLTFEVRPLEAYAEAHRRWLRTYLAGALLMARGNQCEAARIMGVHRNTVRRLMREANLTPAAVRRIGQRLSHQPRMHPEGSDARNTDNRNSRYPHERPGSVREP